MTFFKFTKIFIFLLIISLLFFISLNIYRWKNYQKPGIFSVGENCMPIHLPFEEREIENPTLSDRLTKIRFNLFGVYCASY